jgi:hypothetical protein
MNKKYYFLSGFFRSGNTVLSSILNQNPKIYSSPISSLIEHLWQSNMILKNFEASIANVDNSKRSKTLISNMISTYYSDVDKDIIFDRNKAWINPGNINMIKECNPENIKMIFTTRPVLEMMASYIAASKDSIIANMHYSGFPKDSSLSINDNLADYLFSDYDNFGRNLNWAFESIDNPDNNGVIHVVRYEDLLASPQETMDRVYDFLEIDRFQHDFLNIVKVETYRENLIGFPEDLHKVRPVLGKSDLKIEDYLSPRTIAKYSNARYF